MKLRLAPFVAGFVLLAATIGIHELRATPQETLPTPCVVVVPSDWGEFKGISKYGLDKEEPHFVKLPMRSNPDVMPRRSNTAAEN